MLVASVSNSSTSPPCSLIFDLEHWECLIAQIYRLNLNCYETSSRFPVKIANPISVSNQLLHSMTGIISSHRTIITHLWHLTYNKIMAIVGPVKFFEAGDGCILALVDREPIVKYSIGYWTDIKLSCRIYRRRNIPTNAE